MMTRQTEHYIFVQVHEIRSGHKRNVSHFLFFNDNFGKCQDC